MTGTRLESAYQTALAALLAERHPDGYWVGELSTSALSTATAVMALHLVQVGLGHRDFTGLVDGGLAWLVEHQNDDGGWGDTTKSVSNISTTMLCRSAFHLTGAASRFASTVSRGEHWLFSRYGSTPEQLAEAVRNRYGKDRTFATPILTTCALAGLVSWNEVPHLPFELACLPQSWFRFVKLHVVSYALPALIAIGQAVHQHRTYWNPITLVLRWLAKKPSLRVLQKIHPTSGGFLEATPLTSFVTLSLASIGLANHPVATLAVKFLKNSVRPDGSWPIDTNLSTWVTTLAINALAAAGDLENLDKQEELRNWYLSQQYAEVHPYTGAAPGGWAWTPLPGGVPDADDTPGALLALSHLQSRNRDYSSVCYGIEWLLGLQNRDGGWPTFCRGWGALPFDRSGSDLTAHVLRAMSAWQDKKDDVIYDGYTFDDWGYLSAIWSMSNWRSPIKKGLRYLVRHQRPDGSWLPLWFGNQHAPDDENPTYGTARVLAAYRDLAMMDCDQARRGVQWLLTAQNPDGGWGGGSNTPSTMEETALAVEVLLDASTEANSAASKGVAWLVERVEKGGLHDPSPIGFYFAKLWYYEKLYPIIFTVAALGRFRRSGLRS